MGATTRRSAAQWAMAAFAGALCLAFGLGALVLERGQVERALGVFGARLERSLVAEIDHEADGVAEGGASLLASQLDLGPSERLEADSRLPCRLHPGAIPTEQALTAPSSCDKMRGPSGRALLPEFLLPLGDPAVPRFVSFLERSYFLLSGPQAAYLRDRIETGPFTPSSRGELLRALDSAEPAKAWVNDLSAEELTRSVDGGVFRGSWRLGRLQGTLLDRTSVARRWRTERPAPTGYDVRIGPSVGRATKVEGLRLTVVPEPWLVDTWIVRARVGLVLASLCTGAIAFGVIRRQTLRQRERERLASLRTDFFAAVAHEVRTPVASIRLLAELLEEGLSDESDRPSVHSALRTEAARLSNTVTSLLETARFFRGSDVQARRELVPVSALIERASGFPGVEVDLTRLSTNELVYVDLVLVHLAIDNLLENAARHAPEGLPWLLEVELAPERDELVIHVRDHGPGLPPGPTERLFDAFYRGDDRLTSARGSGLGLALVAHAARAHGGSVSATRPAGGGALFTARFPFPKATASKGES